MVYILSTLVANSFYDYPMFFEFDACQITQQRNNLMILLRMKLIEGEKI